MRTPVPAIDGYALGLQGWRQPIAGAPGVCDGNHLRWSFSTGKGLPWYGYWVLRSESPRQGPARATGSQSADEGTTRGDGGPSVTSGSATTRNDGQDSGSLPLLPQELLEQIVREAEKRRREATQNGGGYSVLAGSSGGSKSKLDYAALLEKQFGVGGDDSLTIAANDRRGVGDVPIGDGVVPRSREARNLRSRLLGRSWQTLDIGGSSPIRLPVTHPAYPLSRSEPLGIPMDGLLAQSRIRYGDAKQPFEPSSDGGATGFQELNELLLRLVQGGPSGPPMARIYLDGERDPDDEVSTSQPRAQLDGRPVLDWLALAAIEPAIAQMLGLYVVDETAQPNWSYDYLVLADFDGAITSAGDPITWLKTTSAGRSGNWERAGVYPCLFEDVRRAPQPELGPPRDVWGCPVRGEMRPMPGSLREMEDATRVVGLRWRAQRPRLLPGGAQYFDAPMERYHVWRADCGTHPQQLPRTAFVPLVDGGVGASNALPSPLLSVDGPGRQAPGRVAPAPRLFLRDVLDHDGFYTYRVACSDVFGRFSAQSAQSAWRPLPDDGLGPRFWDEYEVVDGKINALAIQVLSELPPPAPQAMVATLHDPDDPYDVSYRSPAAYEAWLVDDEDLDADRAKALADELALSPFWQWRAAHGGVDKRGLVLEASWSWSWAASKRTPGVQEFHIELEREVDGKVETMLLAVVPFVPDAKSGWPAPTQAFVVRRDGAGNAAAGVGVTIPPTRPDTLRVDGFDVDVGLLRPGADQVMLEGDSGSQGPWYVLRDMRALEDLKFQVPKTDVWLLLDGAPKVADPAQVKWAVGEAELQWRVFLPVDGLFEFGSWRDERVSGRVRVRAVGVQDSRPVGVGGGPGFVERVRRGTDVDNSVLAFAAPAGGLAIPRPDARGRSSLVISWQQANAPPHALVSVHVLSAAEVSSALVGQSDHEILESLLSGDSCSEHFLSTKQEGKLKLLQAWILDVLDVAGHETFATEAIDGTTVLATLPELRSMMAVLSRAHPNDKSTEHWIRAWTLSQEAIRRAEAKLYATLYQPFESAQSIDSVFLLALRSAALHIVVDRGRAADVHLPFWGQSCVVDGELCRCGTVVLAPGQSKAFVVVGRLQTRTRTSFPTAADAIVATASAHTVAPDHLVPASTTYSDSPSSHVLQWQLDGRERVAGWILGLDRGTPLWVPHTRKDTEHLGPNAVVSLTSDVRVDRIVKIAERHQ